ncbi:XRE family transcriptional regulator [Rhodococcus sp. IEGM 1406]|uniref:helix-turn-helix domain-containing protein n=1 Tax=Rhodococcus sp. IEGM 1406 TaxID=3047083 RepID=UPI0024B66489|nr:XRE family transcriptional regulator [Rhodococcus sp. IEGM 1406]MCD2153266.1 XRE family transcriptional regulator [Rhodococcus cerastii]MDI9905440.1 XRE family transcriptional regulator [Rhodococcus sp. IEGM 1406]
MAAFLRTHRRRAGLTLEGLAEQTGLTKSYLSKVERGISTPSIAVALKIARVLDADVGQLFSDSMEGNAMTIVRAKDRVIDPASSVQSSVYDPIAPSMVGKAMQPFVVHPASAMGPKFMDHTGEEFVFVHSGSVEFEIPGQTMHLDAGDSLYFDANTPHRMRSVSADRAVVLVVVYDNPSTGSPSGDSLEAHCGVSR